MDSDLLWGLAAAGFGPFVGSFLGLVSLRAPARRPFLAGRSACGGCGRTLGAADLLPLLSFAAFKGRCRTCGSAIPRRYLLMETAALGVGLWSALVVGGPLGLLGAVMGWMLLLLAVLDLEHFWLPDALTLPLLGLGLAVTAVFQPQQMGAHLIGAAAGFGFLWAVAAAYRRLKGREGIGGGDFRLLAAAGAWVGWMGLPSVLVWACAAAFAVLGVKALRRGPDTVLAGDSRVAFGAYLALGLWLTWLYGPLGIGRP